MYISIYIYLSIYIAIETLDGDNMYLCEKCNKRRKSTKKLNILRFPQVLVVHLNRFRYNAMFREKLSTDVQFPLVGLNISPYLTHTVIKSENDDIDGDMDIDIDPATVTQTNLTPQSPISPTTPTSTHNTHNNTPNNIPTIKNTNKSNPNHPNHPNQDPILYDLAGVCHHSGSMQGGHYVAHVNTKCHGDDKWMCFNDTRVSGINPINIGGPSAYVLFYTLRNSNTNS